MISAKLWMRAAVTGVLSLALASTIAAAQDHDHGRESERHDRDDDDRDEHGHGHAYGHEKHDRDHDRDEERERHHERYADHDRDLHEWYRTHYSQLPPGFERHLVVNGTLPPELRSKWHPCPHEMEVMLPPPPPNYVHVVIGGNLVLMNRASFQIADVFHFSIN